MKHLVSLLLLLLLLFQADVMSVVHVGWATLDRRVREFSAVQAAALTLREFETAARAAEEEQEQMLEIMVRSCCMCRWLITCGVTCLGSHIFRYIPHPTSTCPGHMQSVSSCQGSTCSFVRCSPTYLYWYCPLSKCIHTITDLITFARQAARTIDAAQRSAARVAHMLTSHQNCYKLLEV